MQQSNQHIPQNYCVSVQQKKESHTVWKEFSLLDDSYFVLIDLTYIIHCCGGSMRSHEEKAEIKTGQ